LALLQLSCVNCSAPLQIGDDLERFACAYCGTSQVVVRSGGTISVKKIESAINAVQRGTDRTAAELALPRLTKELSVALELREKALEQAREKNERALRGRRMLTTIIAIVLLFIGFALIAVAANSSNLSNTKLQVFSFLWLASFVGIPTYVYKKVKLPPDTSLDAVAPHNAVIEKIKAQIKANRAILDEAVN
jgi:DNA-directed RNA polymerase subunit RPC12/RpoP